MLFKFKPGLICVPWLVIFQHGMYDNLLHALVKICKEEGPLELYRGLAPSLIGVVPYAAINYCSYDTLRKTYRRVTKKEHIGNIETLLMGSIAGAVASTATFPLEVARKQMQVMSHSGFLFLFFVYLFLWFRMAGFLSFAIVEVIGVMKMSCEE